MNIGPVYLDSASIWAIIGIFSAPTLEAARPVLAHVLARAPPYRQRSPVRRTRDKPERVCNPRIGITWRRHCQP